MTVLYLYKLKLQDEAGWLSLCNPVIDNEQQQAGWLTKIKGIVTIGTITKPAIIEDEVVVKGAEVVEGWHIDLLAHELIQELVPYCLDHMPDQPVHGDGWAGNSYILVTNTN